MCDTTPRLDFADWIRYLLFIKSKVETLNTVGTIHTGAAERVKEIVEALGHAVLPDQYPAQFQLNLTSSCERKRSAKGDCFNCSFPTNNGSQFDIDQLLSHLRQFVENGGQSIFLSGGGEPGDYKRLDKLLKFLADDEYGQKLELTLNTNGAFVRRIVNLSMPTTDEGVAWRNRLQKIFSGKKNGYDVLSTISISWHEDRQACQSIAALNRLRDDLGLKLAIRTSSLVYFDPQIYGDIEHPYLGNVGGSPFRMTTSVSQIQQIVVLAKQAGADIVNFKPAHVNQGDGRRPVINEPAYEYITAMIDEQELVARANNWDWTKCRSIELFHPLIERSPRLNRLTSSYHKAVDFLGTQQLFCIAPIVMLFGSSRGFAACCDTWDEGLGTKAFLISDTFDLPSQHFLNNIFWMITSIGEFWPTGCVKGCGWTELNLNNPLRIWAIDLVKQFHAGTLSREDVWAEINRYFSSSRDGDSKSIVSDVPPLPLYKSTLD